MSTEFKREERYIVFKLADLGTSFKGDEIRQLAREYVEQRRRNGKPPLECVVVESDWPEYEPTWKAIEARMTGSPEECVVLRHLAIKMKRERDALQARIEAMERQEPVATVRINAINGNPSVDFVPGHRYLHHNDKLYLASGAQPAPSDVRKVVRGFRWDSEAQCHIPTLEVEFDPVPAGHPTDAKGWQDQGRLAAWLCGIPGAQLAPTCAACDG